MDYLLAAETLACLDSFRPRFPSERPPTPRRDELERLLQTEPKHVSPEDAEMLVRYRDWRHEASACIGETRSRIGPLFDAARTFHALKRPNEFSVIARFLRAQYGVTVPPIPERVEVWRIAGQLARSVCLPEEALQ